jgi:repressor LexA
MLTKKQRDLLVYINDYIQKTGLSPSFEEMKQGLDLKSKSGIHRLINALVERGFLARLPNKARALEVVKLPENVPQQAGGSTREAVPSPKRANATVSNFKASGERAMPEMATLPLNGKIAAGTPIEAIRHEQDTIDVPMSMLGAQPCYALTIEGDSMMKAGIMDGDIVIIEECSRANDGDIVVALVDDEEVTLKRLRREIGSIVLMPENDAYEPIRLQPGRVQIQGKLRSLFRTY